MLFHLFVNRLKCLLRNRTTLFWTLLFPILLGTMFHFAFANIMDTENFSTIAVAVADSEAYQNDTVFQQALQAAGEGEAPLLDPEVVSREQADSLLQDGKVDGVIATEDGLSLVTKENGINQTILKTFLDEYMQTSATVRHILTENPGAQTEVFERLAEKASYIKDVPLGRAQPDLTLTYFYALMAMVCLYGSFWGMKNVVDIQSDQSDLGARRSVAPTHKLTSVLCDAAASLVILMGEIMITLLYLIGVLGVDFGNQIGYILLTCFAGCIAGISYGIFVGCVCKKSEAVKTGILTGVTLFLCFLAGLMMVNMKDIIAQNVPLLSYINPAALLTDCFYSLYIFETHTRYFLNIGLLFVISFIFCTVSYFVLRRQKYASI